MISFSLNCAAGHARRSLGIVTEVSHTMSVMSAFSGEDSAFVLNITVKEEGSGTV
jgi:hypothetical protein